MRLAVRPSIRMIGSIWRRGVGVFIATQLGGIINMYIGLVYIPMHLSADELGAVEPVVHFVGFGAIPLAVIGQISVRYLAAYHAQGESGKVKSFMYDMVRFAIVSSVVSICVLLLFFDTLSVRIGIQGHFALVGLAGFLLISCWQPLVGVMLQGVQAFRATAISHFVHPLAFILFMFLLQSAPGLTGFLSAKFFSGVVLLVIAGAALFPFMGRHVQNQSYYADWRGILRLAWPLLIGASAIWFQGFVEPLIIKHRLSTMDSAGYYLANRWGSIPAYLATSVSFVLFPMLVGMNEKGQSTRPIFTQMFLGTFVVSALGLVFMAFAAKPTFSLIPAWSQYLAYSSYVWRIGIVGMSQALIQMYTVHEIARNRTGYLWLTVPVILLETLLIYIIFGWGFFSELLPSPLWEWVDRAIPKSLDTVIFAMIASRILTLVFLIVRWRKDTSLDLQSVPFGEEAVL